jgi:hypothetical protein
MKFNRGEGVHGTQHRQAMLVSAIGPGHDLEGWHFDSCDHGDPEAQISGVTADNRLSLQQPSGRIAEVIGGRPQHAIITGDISFDDKVYSFKCARTIRSKKPKP